MELIYSAVETELLLANVFERKDLPDPVGAQQITNFFPDSNALSIRGMISDCCWRGSYPSGKNDIKFIMSFYRVSKRGHSPTI
jgi:hypothetical protein